MYPSIQIEWDMIVLPGGAVGAEHLRDCEELKDILTKQASRQAPYAAM
jgi:putative intracellular protease/amidase